MNWEDLPDVRVRWFKIADIRLEERPALIYRDTGSFPLLARRLVERHLQASLRWAVTEIVPHTVWLVGEPYRPPFVVAVHEDVPLSSAVLKSVLPSFTFNDCLTPILL